MAGLVTRAANGAALTWNQMDNNLLYLENLTNTLTLQNVTDNGNDTTNDITVVDNAAQQYQTTLTCNALNFYDNGNVIRLSTFNSFTTSVVIQLRAVGGVVALLSDLTNSVVGGIATASVSGGGAQKMVIIHSLGYTPSFALATPINASSSTIPYYVSYTELTDTKITIRFPNMASTTLMGYSYIVK